MTSIGRARAHDFACSRFSTVVGPREIEQRPFASDVDGQKSLGFRIHQERRVVWMIDPCEQHGDLSTPDVADGRGTKISVLPRRVLARKRHALPRLTFIAASPKP